MKILIDTNVIIDAFTDRSPFAKTSGSVLFAVEQGVVTGYVVPNGLIDVYYHIRHILHSKKKARKYVEVILNFFRVLDSTESDCQKAFESGREDFEDAVLMETAHRNHIDYIVTRNVKDFSHSPVPVISPAEFLKKVEK